MAAKTGIEWTDATWSPLRARVKPDAGAIAEARGYSSLIQIATKMQGHVGQHCEHVSLGCKFCYSGTKQGRCLPSDGTGLPFDRRSRDLIDPFVDENVLLLPLKWRTPKRIFVENQSDLFGEWYTDEMIDRVFAVMALCPQHTFQVLTKRPERMREYLSEDRHIELSIAAGDMLDGEWIWGAGKRFRERIETLISACLGADDDPLENVEPRYLDWPLPNAWLGVSAEDQATAGARIPLLLQTPAAKRFVSYEPALGPVDFTNIKCRGAGWMNALSGFDVDGDVGVLNDGLDWIIVGGESGAGARPFDIAWARGAIAQCKAAGVACFVKQLGAVVDGDVSEFPKAGPCAIRENDDGTELGPILRDPKGGDISEWPADLRVREFPAA